MELKRLSLKIQQYGFKEEYIFSIKMQKEK